MKAKKTLISPLFALIIALFFAAPSYAAEEAGEDGKYNPAPMILHHIADANEWHVFGNVTLPLPVIAWSKDDGLTVALSSKFHHGKTAYNGYVMNHGRLEKIQEDGFPAGAVNIGHLEHKEVKQGEEVVEVTTFQHEDKEFTTSRAGFIDFSITKNVVTLFLTAIILLVVFLSVAKAYKNRKGQAPTGLQGFMEPLIVFVRDEIAKPNLGDKTEKFLPYILVVFFFIWVANLLGLIPLIGNPNLTGNIAVTAALAMFTMILTNLNGNKAYWGHIFNPPGAPIFVKPILIIIEFAGVFIKPIALMIRLFANISAGHIIILSLTCLIFVFGNAGESLGGSAAGAALAVPFVLFMSLIELLVAFLQAFIFAMLSALFIGLAVEEHH